MSEPNPRLISLLRIGFAAVVLAALGGALNVIGWYVLPSRALAITGFVVVAVAVGVGIVVVAVGQIVYGREAVKGSLQAMKDLRDIFRS